MADRQAKFIFSQYHKILFSGNLLHTFNILSHVSTVISYTRVFTIKYFYVLLTLIIDLNCSIKEYCSHNNFPYIKEICQFISMIKIPRYPETSTQKIWFRLYRSEIVLLPDTMRFLFPSSGRPDEIFSFSGHKGKECLYSRAEGKKKKKNYVRLRCPFSKVDQKFQKKIGLLRL